MVDRICDIPSDLVDLTVINRGQKIINGLKNFKFPPEYGLFAAVFTGFRSIRLAAEWISSHLNDPLFTEDLEVDFHVLLSLGEKFEADFSSFLSAARAALGWDHISDHRTQIPLLHLRVKPRDALHLESIFMKSFGLLAPSSLTNAEPLEFLVDIGTSVVCKFSDSKVYAVLLKLCETFLENLKKAEINVCVISSPNEWNNPLILVNSINSIEKNLVLIQLKEMYLSDHYTINELNQPVNHQLKFCLYSHDPRLKDSSCEVYEMLTDVEFHSSSPPINSPITNDNHKNGDKKSPTCNAKLTDSPNVNNNNNNQSQCDLYSNQIPASMYHSPGYRGRLLEHYVGDYILLIDSISLNERLGCPLGINLCTGESGLFNISAGRRIPQCQTWTLHCSVPLNLTSSVNMNNNHQHHHHHHNGKTYNEELKKRISQNSCLIVKNTTCNTTCNTNNNTSCPTIRSPCLSTSSTDHSLNFFSSASSSSSSSSTSTSSTSTSSSLSTDPEKSKSNVPKTIANNNNNNSNNNTSHTDEHISENSYYYANGKTTTSCQNELHLLSPLNNTNDEFNEPHSKSMHTNHYRRLGKYTTTHHHNSNKSRQMYVMRHAERVDISFGHGWITQCFDQKGVYRRFNLNLPPWLPSRTDCFEYILDSPITQIGLFVSAETGRALADAGVYFTACYSSPAFRCVQTACELLRAMGRSDLPIRIEPHLFEWYGWYVGVGGGGGGSVGGGGNVNCLPKMMSVQQLKLAGYNVDVNYKPLSAFNDHDKYESIQGYCDRTAVLIKRLLNVHKSKDTCLLIVAHASSLDACTRHLVCHGFRHSLSNEEFQHRTSIVPYCGLLLAQENRRWNLIDPPIPNSCSYARNSDFDWKQLLGPALCNFKLR
ncbi:unnamed protein product [Schistosoma turkestanicum]|nr:unnamed protein product [Schistosoma turkestanicum]